MSENQTGSQSPDWVTFEVANPTLDLSDSIRVRVGEVIIEVKQGYDSDLLPNVKNRRTSLRVPLRTGFFRSPALK